MAKQLTEASIARLLKRMEEYPDQLTKEELKQLAFIRDTIPNAKQVLEEASKKEK